MILALLNIAAALAILLQPANTATEPAVVAPASKADIIVHLQSGRSLAGQVDPQTDPDRFVLRTSVPGGFVARPVQWDRLLWAEIAGEVVSGSQLRQVVAEIRRDHPKPPQWVLFRPLTAVPLGPPLPLPELPQPEPFGPVRSVHVDAQLCNWDADVEPDGLLLTITPRDGYGQALVVRGLVEAQLYAERVVPRGVPATIEPIGRWAQPISPDDFGPYGAICKLSFQGTNPELDRWWGTHAILNVRLSVPGQGVVEASQGSVRIRPASRVRDDLEHMTGHRYLPGELTEGRRPNPRPR